MMQPYFRYSVRGLIKRPLRSFLTIIMLTIALMLISGTRIALESIPSLAESSLEEANMADFSLNINIQPKGVVEEIIGGKKYIKEYELRLTYRTKSYNLRGWPRETDILLIGVDLPLKMNRVTIVKGRLFEENEEVLVAEHDYGENVLGKDLLIKTNAGNVTLKAVGTCRAVWMPRWYGSSVAYALIPLQVLQNISNLGESINQVLVKVREGCNLTEAMNNLSEEFRLHGIIAHISLEGKVVPFIETKTYYNYLISLISLIGFSIFAISLALIYASMSLMVTQEYRYLGELRALGATGSAILAIYIFRGALLGSISGFMGSLLGVIAARAILYGFASLSLIIEGTYFIVGSLPEILVQNRILLLTHTFMGVIFSVLSAIPPVIPVAKMPVIQAIKSFPGLPTAAARLKSKIESYPYFIKYALRSLNRKKGREVAIVMVITISVVINSVLIVASETQQSILQETSDALNFDFILCLSRPLNSSTLMAELEPFLNEISEIEFAYYRYLKAKDYTILSIGLPVNASCFNYPLVDGRHIVESENTLILPENLARMLDVRVTDNLVISTEKTSLEASVVGVRRDPIFNVLITSLNTIQSIDGAEDKVNAVAIKFREGADINNLMRNIRRGIRGYLWDIDKSGVINILSDILTDTFQTAAGVMISFTWITSILLIFAISAQDINEERVVIATLRALGASRTACIIMITFKILVLGLFSALLCTLMMPTALKAFSYYLSSIAPFSASLNLSIGSIYNSALFIISTILPSSLILGVYMANINVASTLKYE